MLPTFGTKHYSQRDLRTGQRRAVILNYDETYAFDPQDLFSNASLITKAAGYESLTGLQLKIGGMIGSSNISGEPDSSEGAPDFSSVHGGIPYDQQPTGIKGYYKWQASGEAMGTMIVIFSKDGANIGTYMHMFSDAADEYTAFEFNFDTPAELTETPVQ